MAPPRRELDPRQRARRERARLELPDDVSAHELDGDVRRELRSLSGEMATLVARHLVAIGRLLDDDPERALAHGRAAVALAGRVAVVREAAGLAAYAAEQWRESLAELRAARRLSGSAEHLAVEADCERGLGRPDRALALLDDAQAAGLAPATRVELLIVAAGARQDLGQVDAAVLLLQQAAQRTTQGRPWAERLWFAYADSLAAAGRVEEAAQWFARAVTAGDETDAADRLLALDGVLVEYLDRDLADLDAADETSPGPTGPAVAPTGPDETGAAKDDRTEGAAAAPGPDALDLDALLRDSPVVRLAPARAPTRPPAAPTRVDRQPAARSAAPRSV